jgi:large subunit ribosomal protein L15
VNLNDVNEGIVKYKKRKRIGRGTGSGLGKTSGRGHNGQGSRSGHSIKPVFQGGAMPMIRRIAKRGFNNKWAARVGEVNLSDLEAKFNAGEEVTPETLASKDLAKYRYDVLKVLGTGELTNKLTVSAHRFSKSAREKIEKAGGTIVVLATAAPVVKNKMGSAKKSKQA